MAISNINSPSKTQIYESLYLISVATQLITEHLDRLQSAKILSKWAVEHGKTAANELRAQLAASSTINLTGKEADNAYWLEKKRIRMEKNLTTDTREKKKPARK